MLLFHHTLVLFVFVLLLAACKTNSSDNRQSDLLTGAGDELAEYKTIKVGKSEKAFYLIDRGYQLKYETKARLDAFETDVYLATSVEMNVNDPDPEVKSIAPFNVDCKLQRQGDSEFDLQQGFRIDSLSEEIRQVTFSVVEAQGNQTSLIISQSPGQRAIDLRSVAKLFSLRDLENACALTFKGLSQKRPPIGGHSFDPGEDIRQFIDGIDESEALVRDLINATEGKTILIETTKQFEGRKQSFSRVHYGSRKVNSTYKFRSQYWCWAKFQGPNGSREIVSFAERTLFSISKITANRGGANLAIDLTATMTTEEGAKYHGVFRLKWGNQPFLDKKLTIDLLEEFCAFDFLGTEVGVSQ